MNMNDCDISGYNLATYSRFNLSKSLSDINVFVQDYRDRINRSLQRIEDCEKTPFVSFGIRKLSAAELVWLHDNRDRFFKDTQNDTLVETHYLSECGFITSMLFTPDGDTIIVGHSSGLIQMRHGSTGTVLCTLRNIQFPPKPVHALEYSLTEDNICYAACIDGTIYRIEIPHVDTSVENPPAYCIRADPMLESLNLQFYGSPGISSYSTPFISQRFEALSLGILADGTRMAVGYGDTSIKVYDIETQEAELTYKVHKLRLQFIPKKLQRMHFGQVVALRAHPQKPYMFASGAWDNTLRIWDVRCKVGCVMTFEGVNMCGDSVDLNREQCLVGSWQPTEGLTLWDLTARKLISIIRIQNRRPDVDGEYIYTCRYWQSIDYNRKGKYGIIGGSGTNCVEVVNLHNRYITCSYPAPGTVLAVTSFQERIAFGGTSSAFSIVSFYDPKHEKDKYEVPVEPDFDYTKTPSVALTLFQSDNEDVMSTQRSHSFDMTSTRPTTPATDTSKSNAC
ncbi:unnamed protein product [Chrysodeixis includens]|uniref:Uncharacterized protein n=1 Tax=Chrysodeixis includens TaxID=689277 RepID=A0A9P0FYI1_CHRIL|nr:unnamed protein product [Chrysodeixis includens]